MKKTKQARMGQIILSGILPVCGNRIHGYRNSKEDGSQRDGGAALQGRGCGICGTCGTALWGMKKLYFRDGLHLSGKGAAVLAEGLSGAVASGLGKVRYLN